MYRILYGAALMGLASMCFATSAIGVPEIDGSGALTAIALLGGVVALVAEKRRK